MRIIILTHKRIMHFNNCLSIIVGSKNNVDMTLVMLRNRSGINFACNEIIIICKCTEKSISKIQDIYSRNVCDKIVNNTMRSMPNIC